MGLDSVATTTAKKGLAVVHGGEIGLTLIYDGEIRYPMSELVIVRIWV